MYILPDNRAHSIFSDPRIRQAIATAIDREALASVAYGDEVSRQTGPFPPLADFPEPIEVYAEPDLEAAKELLVGTACENGCAASLTHFASHSLTVGRSALALQQQLAEIGITLQVEPVESAVFIQNSLDGAFEIAMAESGSFNVQEVFLAAFSPSGTKCVYTGCEDTLGFGAAAQDMLAASDPQDKERAAQEVIEIFEQWLPVVPVAGQTALRGVRTAVMDVIEEQPNGAFWIAAE